MNWMEAGAQKNQQRWRRTEKPLGIVTTACRQSLKTYTLVGMPDCGPGLVPLRDRKREREKATAQVGKGRGSFPSSLRYRPIVAAHLAWLDGTFVSLPESRLQATNAQMCSGIKLRIAL